MFKASIVEEVVECDVCNHWMKVKCPSSNENFRKRANEVVQEKKHWEAVGHGDKHICARCIDKLKSTDRYVDVKSELIEESTRADAPHDEAAVIAVEDGRPVSITMSSHRNMKFVVLDRDVDQYDQDDYIMNIGGEDSIVYAIDAAHNEDVSVIDELISCQAI